MATARKQADATLGEVKIEPKRIVMPAAAVVKSELTEGAALAREIVNTQLKAISTAAKSTKHIDGDDVKTLRDMTAVYETLAKIERDQRRADNLADKLANMTDDELDALDRELARQK